MHVVKEGDTLTSIAEAWFGDGTKWALIQAANPGVDPARLKIDQRLTLPPKNATSPAAPAAAPAAAPGSGPAQTPGPAPAPTPGASYVVREGDTLYSIAKALFGDGTRWDELYDANKATIGSDPKALRSGMKLVMPK